MGLHRTFLFMLVVGLIIAAFRRGLGPSDSHKTDGPAMGTPAASPAVLTNGGPGSALAASGLEVHK
jgi:hypothetical protein